MKAIFILMICVFLTLGAKSQLLQPVKWSYAAKKLNAKEAMVLIKAVVEPGWHIYSITQPPGGPVKTTIAFSSSGDFKLLGKVLQPKPAKRFEKAFGIDVYSFEDSVIFQQRILLNSKNAVVKGTVEFMVCNDKTCLPPESITFEVPIK